MMDLGTFNHLKNYTKTLIEKGKRLDNREFLQYRKIKIIPNYIKTAEGSAYVEIGKTKVLAGVKLEVGEPFPDTPNKGIFIVSEEVLPSSFPTVEAGPPSPEAIEIARVVDRGIRSAEALDLSKMVIEEGKFVWIAFIDIYVLNDDGNVIDASFLAAITSLLTARFPKLEKKNGEYEVNSKVKTNEKLPVTKVPITVTTAKIGKNILVDPTKIEEDIASIVSITVTDNEINSIQLRSPGELDLGDLQKVINIAQKKSKELKGLLLKAIK